MSPTDVKTRSYSNSDARALCVSAGASAATSLTDARAGGNRHRHTPSGPAIAFLAMLALAVPVWASDHANVREASAARSVGAAAGSPAVTASESTVASPKVASAAAAETAQAKDSAGSVAASTTSASTDASDTKAKPAKKVTLKGLVQDDKQQPLGGATVTVVAPKSEDDSDSESTGPGPRRIGRWRQRRDRDEVSFFSAKSDPSGAFLVEAEGDGPFNIRVDAPGFAPMVLEKVKAGQGSSLVSLKRGISALGSVADLASGAPVPDAEILALSDMDKGFRDPDDPKRFATIAKTGRDGSFAFSNLAPGFYGFRVIAANRASFELPEKPIGDAGQKPLIFYLEPGFDVSGRVLDPAGKPAAKMGVRAQPGRRSISALRMMRGTTGPLYATTDKDGKFSIHGVPSEGKYTVEVDSKDYAPASVDIPASRAGAGVTGLDVHLEKGVALHAKLVDAEQKPVKTDVEVSMTYRDPKTRRVLRSVERSEKDVHVTPAGELTLDRLPTGTASLTLSPKGFKDVDKKDIVVGRDPKGTDLGTIALDRGKKITGRVLDDSGKAIQGAKVSASSWGPGSFSGNEAKTDASGKFTLSGLEDGSFTVQASAKGYGQGSKSEVSPDKEPIDLTLNRAGTLKGRLMFGNPGKPIANFTVEANPKESADTNPAFRMFRMNGTSKRQSDPKGEFTLEGLTPGSYTIVAKADGLQDLLKEGVDVRGGETTDVGELTLEAGGVIKGKVVSKPEGLPVAGAAVRVKGAGLFDPRNFGGNRAGSVMTDLAGRFEIRGLPTGQATIIVEPAGLAKAEVSGINISPGSNPDEITVNVGKGGRIEGRVLGPDGRPKSGTMVTAIAGLTEFSANLSAITDDQGKYSIENVAAGTYRVTNISRFGGGDDDEESDSGGRRGMFGGMDAQSADVKEGETAVVNFGEKSIKVSGSLKRKSGEIAKQMVMFVPPGKGMRGVQMATTDDNGHYEVSLGEGGDYDVYVGDQGMRGGTAIKATIPDRPDVSYDIVLPEGGIVGRVLDQETGAALKGVLVYATPTLKKGEKRSIMGGGQGARTMSGDDGSYALKGLAPGSYDMGFIHEGHGAENRTVEVKGTEETTVNQILGAGLPFKVRVTNPSGGTITGALVMVSADGAPLAGVGGMTHEDGSFDMKQLKNGSYSFTALTREFAPGVARDIVVGGEGGVDNAVITLTPGGAARVMVQDGEKKPISGASLLVESTDTPDLNMALELMLLMRGAPAISGADGSLDIEHLPAGKYDITATKGEKKVTKGLTVEEGGKGSVTITIE